jgi:hypothetical protein
MPVAMVFTKQLLLTQKSSVSVAARADGGPTESYTVRAVKLTTLLKSIPGFSHGGLND